MLIKVNLSTSASKKQIKGAKILFGSKGESIIKSLEEASKSKFLATGQVDALLDWLKGADEAAVQKYADSAAGKKLVAPAKAYANNKSFDGKMKALAAIKFKAPTAKGTSTGVAGKVKLPKRGPYQVEVDLSADMNSDGSFNLSDADSRGVHELFTKEGVGVELLELHGSGGGNPSVNLHGTKAALTKIIVGWYGREDLDLYDIVPANAKGTTKKSSAAGHMADIAPLMAAHSTGVDKSHQTIKKAFKQVFGVTVGSGEAGSVDVGGESEGIFFDTKSGKEVVLLYNAGVILAGRLGVPASAKYVVYTDSYEDEGPFIGDPIPLNKPKAYANYKAAKAEFIKQIGEFKNTKKLTKIQNIQESISLFETWVERSIKQNRNKDIAKVAAAFAKQFKTPLLKPTFMGLDEEGAAAWLVGKASTDQKRSAEVRAWLKGKLI